MPPMSSASVTNRPWKPSESRSTLCITFGSRVAGRLRSPLIAGIATCPDMMNAAPATTAARNGTSSRVSSRAQGVGMTGRARWLSVSVSPWPGKCLAVASIP